MDSIPTYRYSAAFPVAACRVRFAYMIVNLRYDRSLDEDRGEDVS